MHGVPIPRYDLRLCGTLLGRGHRGRSRGRSGDVFGRWSGWLWHGTRSRWRSTPRRGARCVGRACCGHCSFASEPLSHRWRRLHGLLSLQRHRLRFLLLGIVLEQVQDSRWHGTSEVSEISLQALGGRFLQQRQSLDLIQQNSCSSTCGGRAKSPMTASQDSPCAACAVPVSAGIN